MKQRPPSTARVLMLLARSALLRLLRATQILRARARKPGQRGPTARKGKGALLALLPFMILGIGMNSLMLSTKAVYQLAEATSNTTVVSRQESPAIELNERQRLRHAYDELVAEPLLAWSPSSRAALIDGSAWLVATLLLLAFVGALGGPTGELGRPEWSLPWLLTFPVPTRAIVLAKVGEYGLVAFFPWLTLFPFLWQLLRALAHPQALLLAAVATLCCTLLLGALRCWIETWLRQHCTLHRLRSVQGACSLLAIACMASLYAACLRDAPPKWLGALARATPNWCTWLPVCWPAAVARHGWLGIGIGGAFTIAAVAQLTAATTRLLQRGTLRSGGVDPGTRGRGERWARGDRLHGVLGKDLRLLLRDRNFLVATVLTPLLMIGLQAWFNPGIGQLQRGAAPAMLAYGIGAFAVTGGCFQVLSGEGRALWMLYTLPVELGSMLARKVRLWASFAVAAATLAMLVVLPHSTSAQQFGIDLLFVVVGVWCTAHLAAGIAALGTDPAADHVPRQLKARYVYLYLFLSGTFAIALRGDELAPRIAGLIVFATLVASVWQQVRDRIPWLLDPVDRGAPVATLYDAGIAVMTFWLLQTLLLIVLLLSWEDAPAMVPSLIAFVGAGALTFAGFAVAFALRGISMAQALGLRAGTARPGRAIAFGVACGLALAAFGVAYSRLAVEHEWFGLQAMPPLMREPIMLLIAVVAAPLIEEPLFRGLVLQGMLRSVRPWFAIVWSATLFTMLHPAPAWPPVFVLGITTAVIRLRTNSLAAPMLVHVLYNLAICVLGA